MILMTGATMKVTMTIPLIVKILATNAGCAGPNIHITMNRKNAVARQLLNGFNMTYARSGSI